MQAGALNLFAAQVRERDRLLPSGLDPRQNEGRDRDHLFGGAYLDAAPGDLYVLHDRNAAGPGVEDVNRTTVGGRAERPATDGLFFEAEAAWQFGTQGRLATPAASAREQDIGAWFAVGRLGWARPEGALRSARVGLDWLSGDDDPRDGDYGAFHTLYASNPKFYGTMDLLLDPAQTGGRGLVDATAAITLSPGPNPAGITLDAALHRFWLAEGAGGERALGWEADLALPFTVGSGVRGQAGLSLFRTAAAAPEAGLPGEGEWLHWGFVQLTVGI